MNTFLLILALFGADVITDSTPPIQIIGRQIITLTTNWNDFQKIVPVCNVKDCKLEHFQIVKQTGTITTNISVRFDYAVQSENGRKMPVEVLCERIESKDLPIERQVHQQIQLHTEWIILDNGNLIRWKVDGAGRFIGN